MTRPFRIVIPAPDLPSANLFYAGIHHRVRHNISSDWHTRVIVAARDPVFGDPLELDPPYHIKYFIYPPNRKKDITNYYIKMIEDGLVLARVIPNDSLKYVTAYTVRFAEVDKENPRVEIEIHRDLRES